MEELHQPFLLGALGQVTSAEPGCEDSGVSATEPPALETPAMPRSCGGRGTAASRGERDRGLSGGGLVMLRGTYGQGRGDQNLPAQQGGLWESERPSGCRRPGSDCSWGAPGLPRRVGFWFCCCAPGTGREIPLCCSPGWFGLGK